MGDLTKNFSRSEFACRGSECCGHSAPISLVLVDLLQELRDTIGGPLTINSGFRCNKYNAAIGGSLNSQHRNGLAADIALPRGLTIIALWGFITEMDFTGIGLYDNFIHVDIREGDDAFWDRRTTHEDLH